jgi:hypothetical protein
MPTPITFKDALRATKFVYFLTIVGLRRDGKINQVRFALMVSPAGDWVLKPELDAKYDAGTDELLFYQSNRSMLDGSLNYEEVYRGQALAFLDSHYAKNYWARIKEYWNVADLIYQMRDELVKLVGNPLDRYQGDFTNTALHELWRKRVEPKVRDYGVPVMLKLLPLNEAEQRDILTRFNSSDAATQREIQRQVSEKFTMLQKELTTAKSKEIEIEIIARIRGDAPSNLSQEAYWAVLRDFDDVLDGKIAIEQMYAPYLERRQKNVRDERNDDMNTAFQLKAKYGVP